MFALRLRPVFAGTSRLLPAWRARMVPCASYSSGNDMNSWETASNVLRDRPMGQSWQPWLENRTAAASAQASTGVPGAGFPTSKELSDEEAKMKVLKEKEPFDEPLTVTATGAPGRNESLPRGRAESKDFEDTAGGRSAFRDKPSGTGAGAGGSSSGAGAKTTFLSLGLLAGGILVAAHGLSREQRESLPDPLNTALDSVRKQTSFISELPTKIEEEAEKVKQSIANTVSNGLGGGSDRELDERTRAGLLQAMARDMVGTLWLLESHGFLSRGILTKNPDSAIPNIDVDRLLSDVERAAARHDEQQMAYLFGLKERINTMRQHAKTDDELKEALPYFKEMEDIFNRLHVRNLAHTRQFYLSKS